MFFFFWCNTLTSLTYCWTNAWRSRIAKKKWTQIATATVWFISNFILALIKTTTLLLFLMLSVCLCVCVFLLRINYIHVIDLMPFFRQLNGLKIQINEREKHIDCKIEIIKWKSVFIEQRNFSWLNTVI